MPSEAQQRLVCLSCGSCIRWHRYITSFEAYVLRIIHVRQRQMSDMGTGMEIHSAHAIQAQSQAQERQVSYIFTIASQCNSIVAILSGVVADVSIALTGQFVTAFDISTLVLLTCMIWIYIK